ncbi:MAG: hypothetical protein KAK04_07900, partial [Cyclobacteriaceae bacterium]|nr:hypothetical protein [Cyclobacteriaceae bacterium]
MYVLKQMWSLVFISTLIISCSTQNNSNKELSVKEVMDGVITRLYKEVPSDKYNSIDDRFILDFLSEEEKS